MELAVPDPLWLTPGYYRHLVNITTIRWPPFKELENKALNKIKERKKTSWRTQVTKWNQSPHFVVIHIRAGMEESWERRQRQADAIPWFTLDKNNSCGWARPRPGAKSFIWASHYGPASTASAGRWLSAGTRTWTGALKTWPPIHYFLFICKFSEYLQRNFFRQA